MLNLLNSFFLRWMPILTPVCLIIGVILENLGKHLLIIIPLLFAFMTFASSLTMNFNDIKGIRKYPKIILGSIVFLHILMPIWAYYLSTWLFHDHLLMIGFVLSVAVPTGVTSVIWVSISKGNISLCLSIILLDTLLAPVIMPLIIHLVAGESIHVNTVSLIGSLLWMIVLPSIFGVCLNEWTKGRIQKKWTPILAPFSKISLFLIVLINSSAIAPYIKNINFELFKVVMTVFLLATSGYIIALLLIHFGSKSMANRATFLFTGGMRNISVGVVIATSYFPIKVAMPVVFGMLFQQVLAAVFSKVYAYYRSHFSRVRVNEQVEL